MKNKIYKQPAIHRRWIKEGRITKEESERLVNEWEAEQGYKAQVDALEDSKKDVLTN